MCSKTFNDSIFEEFFEAQYGLTRAEIAKINIKGVFQIWCHDGSYHEVPLKEGHAWTARGASRAPISPQSTPIFRRGDRALADWTLTVVRSELGQEVLDEMVQAAHWRCAPGTTTGALALMGRLSVVSAAAGRFPPIPVRASGCPSKAAAPVPSSPRNEGRAADLLGCQSAMDR